jgi:16S rRNA (uracil1498-N3)-methyltransferase
MSAHRFHVPKAAPGTVELPEAARQHATRVIRLGVGDRLRVFDAGSEFEATIAAIEKHRVLIDIGAAVSAVPERRTPLHLIMSPLKGDLTELVIQKATELGVATIKPAIFEHTDTVARREPTEARIERWRRVAASAAEQSGRCVVPRVETVLTLTQAIAALGSPREGDLRIVAAEPRVATEPASISPKDVRSITVAVGPAGGLGPSDLDLLSGAGFMPERFAVHTLRSETACVAALAILGARYP